MRARREIAVFAALLLIIGASCGRDVSLEVGAGQQAIVRSENPFVNSSRAPGAQNATAIAANSDGSVLIAAYTDARGAQTNPVSLSGVARSTDLGVTWAEVAVGPEHSGTLPCPADGQLLGSPHVAYEPTRDVFVYASTYVRSTDNVQGISLHVSNGGASAGTSWDGPLEVTPTFIPGERAGESAIDVNSTTGRIHVTWLQQGSLAPKILHSTSDDLGRTWSSASELAQVPRGGVLGAPAPRVLPGTTNADSVVYAVWRSGQPGIGMRNIGCSRSTDGGVTWSPAADLDAVSYPPEDQVLGVDRVTNAPSIDVDPSTSRAYVVYQRNDAHGTGDIALRAFTGPCAPDDAVLLNSDPGRDRAQFFPVVAVDRSTGTVHVSYYDQDTETTGDLTEVMHTASRDQGVTWSPPTPLSNRPFHAGYGNDTRQPNLGEYNGAIAFGGRLFSVFTMTSVAPRFDEGQPTSPSFLTPDVYCDVRDEADSLPLRVAAASARDVACGSTANGAIDPDEPIDVTISLENYVANSNSGAEILTGVSATLSTEMAGATVELGAASYGSIGARDVAVNTVPFQLTITNDFTLGAFLELTLSVTSDQGSAELPVRIATGVAGTPVALLSERFDDAGPGLPSGWQSVRAGGSLLAGPWVVAPTLTPGNNAAFHDEAAIAASVGLLSPPVDVPTSAGVSYLTLDFDLVYDLEDTPSQLVQAMDGLTVRVGDLTPSGLSRSVLAEAFAEEIKTGADNHFPKHLPPSDILGYLQDQSVWSGRSRGVKHVSMRFPGAGMGGRTVQLRFEYTQDDIQTCTDVGSPGPCGVAVDNIVFAQVPVVANSCAADLSVTQSHTPEPVLPGGQTLYTIEVSNQGPRDATHVALTDVIPNASSLAGVSGAGWACDSSPQGFVCQLPALAAGARSSIEMTTNAPRAGATESNVATVSAAEYDPKQENNVSVADNTVSDPPLIEAVMSIFTRRVPPIDELVIYAVILGNVGDVTQADNAGPEFIDVLPIQIVPVNAICSAGTVTMDPTTNTVTWDGRVPPDAPVSITIQAQILPGTEDLFVSNQGAVLFDGDADGTNESFTLTDDPEFSGTLLPTVLQVAPAVCGDGVLSLLEECDDGNRVGGDCCSEGCLIEPQGTVCRVSAANCDAAELCDGVTGLCPPDTLMPNGVPCSDDNLCNGAETCAFGVCVAGAPLSCDDGDSTTTDSCDPALGCVFTPDAPVSPATSSAASVASSAATTAGAGGASSVGATTAGAGGASSVGATTTGAGGGRDSGSSSTTTGAGGGRDSGSSSTTSGAGGGRDANTDSGGDGNSCVGVCMDIQCDCALVGGGGGGTLAGPAALLGVLALAGVRRARRRRRGAPRGQDTGS